MDHIHLNLELLHLILQHNICLYTILKSTQIIKLKFNGLYDIWMCLFIFICVMSGEGGLDPESTYFGVPLEQIICAIQKHLYFYCNKELADDSGCFGFIFSWL